MMKFKGVMPALVSPLDANEKINVPVLNQLLTDLLAKGADGFYLCGATGEGIAIDPEQRMVLAEEAIKTVGGRKPCGCGLHPDDDLLQSCRRLSYQCGYCRKDV